MEWFPIANGIASYCERNMRLLFKRKPVRSISPHTGFRYIYIRESLLFITLTILLL